jgi:hypothetical protein
MRDMCLNLDCLDGILIEMVVEEREPGVAVVVVASDLDRGTILAHSAAFTYLAQTKILAGNNKQPIISCSRPLNLKAPL